MNFSMIFVLLVFCASKVHCELSNSQSWDSRVRSLTLLENQAKNLVDELGQFYENKILNYANNMIYNESIFLFERTTNASLAAMVHVNDHYGVYECFGPFHGCVDVALHDLQELTQKESNPFDNDSTSFEKCANQHLQRTYSYRVKLQEVKEILVEMQLFIRNSTMPFSGSCLHITPTTAAELCLASREPKVKLFLQYISESVLRFKEYALLTVSKELTGAKSCMINIYYSTVAKMQDVVKDALKCFEENRCG